MSESFLQIEKLFDAITDPEYRFLLLEPLIFYGILFGILIFIVSYFMKAERFQMVALIVIGVAALAHLPYLHARFSAQPRMEQVYKITSPARVKSFNENSNSWKDCQWVFMTLATVAGATVLVGSQRNKLGLGLAIATLLLSLLAIKDSLWLHYQDSIAYHPNLKQHEAPISERRKTTSTFTVPSLRLGGSESPPVTQPMSSSTNFSSNEPILVPIEVGTSSQQSSSNSRQSDAQRSQNVRPLSTGSGFQQPPPANPTYQVPRSSVTYQQPRPYVPN